MIGIRYHPATKFTHRVKGNLCIRHTDGTFSVNSTADVGGKKDFLNELASCANVPFEQHFCLRIRAMYEAKKQQNLQLLDILACNSASKPSFQNPTKKSACPILKRWYNKGASNISYGFTNPNNVRICADPPTHP